MIADEPSSGARRPTSSISPILVDIWTIGRSARVVLTHGNVAELTRRLPPCHAGPGRAFACNKAPNRCYRRLVRSIPCAALRSLLGTYVRSMSLVAGTEFMVRYLRTGAVPTSETVAGCYDRRSFRRRSYSCQTSRIRLAPSRSRNSSSHPSLRMPPCANSLRRFVA